MKKLFRCISSKELADIPDNGWENPPVNTNKYYQSALKVFEVDRDTYQEYKAIGGLCQEYKNRYYIA